MEERPPWPGCRIDHRVGMHFLSHQVTMSQPASWGRASVVIFSRCFLCRWRLRRHFDYDNYE